MFMKWLVVVVSVLIAGAVPSVAADGIFKRSAAQSPTQIALADVSVVKGSISVPVLPTVSSQGAARPADGAGGSSAAASGTQARPGRGLQLSVPAMPEPSGWAMLLCGVAVLGFMVVRKSGRDWD